MAEPTGNSKRAAYTGYKGRRPFALATETLVVFRGRVQSFKTGRSVIQTKTARFLMWWAGGVLPPDIFVGQVIMGVGKLKTYDNGRSFVLSDVLYLTGDSWNSMMQPIFKRLFMFAADPAEIEGMPKEVIMMYRGKRGWEKAKPTTPHKPTS